METVRKALEVVLSWVRRHPNGKTAKDVFLQILRLLPPVPNVPGAEVFFELMRKMVPLSVELILVRDGMVYLTYRTDKFFTGWHLPGTYREPRRSLIEDMQRCATKELGSNVRITSALNVGFFEHPESPRFHDACILIRCEFEGEPHGGQWFSECPPDLIEEHRVYWPVVAEQLSR